MEGGELKGYYGREPSFEAGRAEFGVEVGHTTTLGPLEHRIKKSRKINRSFAPMPS